MEFKDDGERELFKKAAAKAALEKVFREKKKENGADGSGEVTGNAFDDGNKGMVKAVLDTINPMTYLRMFISYLVGMAAPYVLLFSGIAMVVVVIVALLFQILAPIAETSSALNTVLSILGAERTFINSELTDEEIEERLSDLSLSEEDEAVLTFALSRVGYPYSQSLRTSGTHYDCSSLAYYAYQEAGIDLSYGNGGVPTAAEGARIMNEKGYAVSPLEIAPGDLVYYGGHANGRYMGIYHVAIYIGNGLCVEALNSTYGVVLQNLRIINAALIIRPQ